MKIGKSVNHDHTKHNKIVRSDYYRSFDDLDIAREQICVNGATIGWIEIKLNQRTLIEIENAWFSGTLVSISDGKMWLDAERVHSVLRTDKASASKWVILLPDRFKVHIDEHEYVDAVALVASLHQRIPQSRDDYQRAYREFSWRMLTALRTAPQVQQLHRLLRLDLDKALSKLKKKRIDKYALTHDELTGEKLTQTSEFSHIRSKDLFPELALFVWNGLVVNKPTHRVITDENVTDELELWELCTRRHWNILWYEDFSLNFKECEIRHDNFFYDFRL